MNKLEEKNAYHIEVLNHELGEVKCVLEGIKVDVSWLKDMFCKAIWMIAVPMGFLVVGMVIELIK